MRRWGQMSSEQPNEDSGPPEEEPLPYPGVAPVVFSLTQTSCPRRLCLGLTCNLWWNYISAVVVLLNCVFMAWYDPCKGRGSVLEVLDYVCFSFFTIEMIMKVVALGFFGHDRSYLKNNWNKLDLFIIYVEMLGFILRSINVDISWLQDFLRPQRVISRIPSMLSFVKMLLETLPLFGNILFLCNFIILIFSVIGVQMWAGALRNRCFLGVNMSMYNFSLPPFYTNTDPLPFTCSPSNKSGMQRCQDIPAFVQNGTMCLASLHAPITHNHKLMPLMHPEDCYDWHDFYNVCRKGDENPFNGAISFDHVGYAWIVVFQVITLEGWTEIMFMIMDVFSFWSFIYFVLVTIIGAFVVMNVCAVVISTQFSDSMEKQQNEDPGRSPVKTLVLHWLQEIYERTTKFWTTLPWCQNMSHYRLISFLVNMVWSPIRPKVQWLVVNIYFQRTIMFLVFLSVVDVAVEHDKQPPELTQFVWISNVIFNIIFIVEMLLKLIAYTHDYFKDMNNILEFVIVIASAWELKIHFTRYSALLRLMRLILFVPYLKKQLILLKKTILGAVTLCAITFLFIFTFSVLGMHWFGCKSAFKNYRNNFDSLLWAMVTVFQLLTQDDWNMVMYNAMAATTPWASLYFVIVIVLGRHLLLNVLVSIVVQGFHVKEESNESATRPENNVSGNDNTSFTDITTAANPAETDQTEDISGPSTTDGPSTEDMAGSEDNTTEAEEGQNINTSWIQKYTPSWCKERKDWSLFLVSPKNKFRVFCQRLTSHVMFDRAILFFIVLTCVTIAIERPTIHERTLERYVLDWSGYVFSGIFLMEMILKIIALGLVFGKGSYCSSPWNLIDGVLVILFVMHTVSEMSSSEQKNLEEILKPLRLLRTLCPLRVIKRAPRLKYAVKGVIASLKPIGSVFVISCVLFSFYGILGVQLFKGKFYNCMDKYLIDVRNVTNKTQCLESNYIWTRRSFNFDSLPQALMSLFVMYSQDGWLDIVYDGLDAVAEDTEPVTNYNQWLLFYFLSFMMASFLLLDMFISILVDEYAEVDRKQREHRKSRVSKTKKVWQKKKTEEVPYYTSYSPMRRSIHSLCTNKAMDLVVMATVVLSVLVMAVEHYQQPKYVAEIIEDTFFLATAILVLEVILKIVAFGPKRYLKNNWNLLDVLVILVSVVSLVFSELNMTHTLPINPNILRVCRVVRLVQVLKSERIRVLVRTIIKTLKQVGNLCLLFIFFFYIYAVLGVELLGDLECSAEYPCGGLHRHANFKHFGLALMALYKVSTGDNWSGILKDTLKKCHPEDEDCAGYLFWAAPLVFITFVIMVSFLLVNLVVSSIIQALQDTESKTTDAAIEDVSVCEENQPTSDTNISHSDSTETAVV